MKISDPVIDLRTDWHPKKGRFLEGNAGIGPADEANSGRDKGPNRGPESAGGRTKNWTCPPRSAYAYCVWAFPFLPNQTKKSAAPPMPRPLKIYYTSCVAASL